MGKFFCKTNNVRIPKVGDIILLTKNKIPHLKGHESRAIKIIAMQDTIIRFSFLNEKDQSNWEPTISTLNIVDYDWDYLSDDMKATFANSNFTDLKVIK